jgi:hypothetical protein
LNIIDAYQQMGTYRAAARLCGVTHKTVRRAVERQRGGGPWARRSRSATRNTDPVLAVLARRVKDTDGRISAKRLLPVARVAGYTGSARNLRRAVAKIKKEHRQKRRLYRPWVPSPGQHLVIDWTLEARLHIFCAVLAWSRYRFVRFALNETRETTLALLAECFEELGDYLASLEWIRAQENLCLVGPAGTGKSHLLVALGYAAVAAGHRVRYFAAADLVETLYRGLADNSVGRVIDAILRSDLVLLDELGFAPLDPTGGQLLFRFVAAAYERRSLGIASHWPFNEWGHFLPDQTTAVSLIDRLLHHAVVVVTAGESFRMREARTRGGTPLKED